MSSCKIAASILSSDLSRLAEQLAELENAGADWIHIDVMDGMFVPNITFGPVIVDACRQSCNLPIDAHLMIEEPHRYIKDFAQAGANSISVHIEENPNIHRTIQLIKQYRCAAGVAINPGTPASALDAIFAEVDFILVMTVNPGFSGQTFIPTALNKISIIKANMQNQGVDIPIQVDGGINTDNIVTMKVHGATIFVAATAIFGHPDGISAGVISLRKALIKKKITANAVIF